MSARYSFTRFLWISLSSGHNNNPMVFQSVDTYIGGASDVTAFETIIVDGTPFGTYIYQDNNFL